jgi:hypothetical protein
MWEMFRLYPLVLHFTLPAECQPHEIAPQEERTPNEAPRDNATSSRPLVVLAIPELNQAGTKAEEEHADISRGHYAGGHQSPTTGNQ